VAGKRKNDQILQYRLFVDVRNLVWWARVACILRLHPRPHEFIYLMEIRRYG
jgi:hypothetical protein